MATTFASSRISPGKADFPGSFRLEKLSGARSGEYSIRINRQWRICFRFESGDAFDVGIDDYH